MMRRRFSEGMGGTPTMLKVMLLLMRHQERPHCYCCCYRDQKRASKAPVASLEFLACPRYNKEATCHTGDGRARGRGLQGGGQKGTSHT